MSDTATQELQVQRAFLCWHRDRAAYIFVIDRLGVLSAILLFNQ